MRSHKLLFWVIPFFIFSLATACTSPIEPPEINGHDQEKIVVTVSILPQKYFVSRIGGDLVDVNVMVQPGDNPHVYEPKPEQFVQISKSKVYFSIGVEFEEVWLSKFTAANDKMRLVDTTAGIEKIEIETISLGSISTKKVEADHAHDFLDPHVWTSPELVKMMSINIYETLSDIDPENKQVYKENLDEFITDINDLESEIRDTLSSIKTNKIMVFHPAWGYFARDFGLEMITVEIGGQEPSAAELAEIITLAKKENIKVVFAQPEFNVAAANTIAQALDGEVLLISPLALDWLENLRYAANTFARVLGN